MEGSGVMWKGLKYQSVMIEDSDRDLGKKFGHNTKCSVALVYIQLPTQACAPGHDYLLVMCLCTY